MNKELMKRLYYFAMFDGHLQKRFPSGNARLAVSMTEAHSDYIELVAQTLDKISIGYKVAKQDRTGENPDRNIMVRLQTASHPVFTKIWERLYINNHKVIDPHLLAMLDSEALAIAFMADGGRYLDKKWAGATPQYAIHTNGLSYGDNLLLRDCIKDLFNIEFNIDKKNQYFQLRLRRRDSETFENIVSPFILSSFNYKLGR